MGKTILNALKNTHYSFIENLASTGQVAQLVRVLFQYTKVAGSILGQDTYKNQPINV